MKMVKSLLLGSAAGVVAFTGAQAADLPVKARPAAVDYVRICSVYGAGFYYVPGTDTCLKVGGFVRADIDFNGQENGNTFRNGGGGRFNREDTPYYNTRFRGILSLDARTQTEWGTLRSYIRAGWEMNTSSTVGAGGVLWNQSTIDETYRGRNYFDRAFIQFAGLTVGKTQSFFDFYANALNYTTSWVGGSDTGHGINILAYTQQFAGGFSATVSLEDTAHRRTGLWDASTNGLGISNVAGVAAVAPVATAGGVAGFLGGSGAAGSPAAFAGPNGAAVAGGGSTAFGNYAAPRYPDVVGSLRVDQPWGSAQVMGAVHDASGSCYGATCNPVGTATDPTGYPRNYATGYAAGAGAKFNLPWAQGDEFWVQATYAKGATSYTGFNAFVTNNVIAVYSNRAAGTPSGVPGDGLRQGSFTPGWALDGVFQNGSKVELTDSWQVVAAVQHFWTPSLRTSVFGGYAKVDYGSAATNLFCSGVIGNIVVPGARSQTTGAVLNPGVCNPDFSVTQVGTRTIWSPVANLDIGVEVLYTRWDQSFVGDFSMAASGARPAGAYQARDADQWVGLLRFQRNFWP